MEKCIYDRRTELIAKDSISGFVTEQCLFLGEFTVRWRYGGENVVVEVYRI